MVKKRLAAILLTLALAMSAVTPAFAGSLSDDSDPITYGMLADTSDEGEGSPAADEEQGAEDPEDPEDPEDQEQTLGEVLKDLFLTAGLAEKQLGSLSDCVALADSLGMLDKDVWDAKDTVSAEQIAALETTSSYQALCEALDADTLEPLFINGMAQPIFPYTTGAVTEGYSNADSDIIRFCVYVETNYDTDGDGKLDLVKALVQLPKSAAEGNYQAATIYEARPYITGCTDRRMGYDYETGYDMDSMYAQPDPRDTKVDTIEDWDDAEDFYDEADASDWYYFNPFESMMDYEDLEWYDYYLVRGFAVVECGGLGTRGSEGFETCGSDLEIDAFKCVIEWLNGESDRVAYTDKDATTAIEAYWSNGKVGMTGRSYAGTTQFGLAATGVKGLETIVPVAGIASWYEYTNSQGIATSGVAYTQSLAAYCAGRYLDSQAAADRAAQKGIDDYAWVDDYSSIADAYSAYLGALANQQYELNGDYASADHPDNDTWKIRDYTVDTDGDAFSCSALIVHGLNDENVKTKQFDLMYQTFRAANNDEVKILLHQDGHLTPTYPAGGLVFDIGENSYDEILNRWFSHYLYDVDNGAEDMPAVTAQDSHDPDKWNTYSSWETAASVTLYANTEAETTTITSDLTATGTDRRNWQANFVTGSTANSVMYTVDVDEAMTVKGSVAVTFEATVDMVDETVSLADQDALMVSAMLVDLGPAEGGTFKALNTAGSYVPKNTLAEGGAWMGGGLKNFDLTELVASDVTYKIIGKGWMDLCNPDAGYASATADEKVVLDGTYHTYTLYLQPNLYTVEAGHKLGVVVYTYEPGKANYANHYTVTVDHSTVSAVLPLDKTATTDAAVMALADTKNFYGVTYAADNGKITSSVKSGTKVLESTEVTLTATADSGYQFAYWTVNGQQSDVSGTTLTFAANEDINVTAVFTKISSGSSGTSSSGSSASGKHGVTVGSTANGSVSVSPKSAKKGDTVTITVNADAGYEMDTIKVTDRNGDAVKVTKNSDGTYSFTMPDTAVTVEATFAETVHEFADVPASAYYYKAVQWAAKLGITGGVTANTFAPDAPCTRAQIVTFLYRCAMAMGGDVSTGGMAVRKFADYESIPDYAAAAMQWAVNVGILQGNDNFLDPNAPCTRAQVVAFLFRYAAVMGMDAVTLQELVSSFADADQIPTYAVSAMNWAVASGIMQGNAGSVMPNAPCTRAQIVTFLYRFLAD